MPEPTPDARPDAREQLAAEIERLIDQLDALDGADDDLEPEEDACDDADAEHLAARSGFGAGDPEDEEITWAEPWYFWGQGSPMIRARRGAESDDAEEDDAGEDNGDHEAVSARNHCDQTEWAYNHFGTEDDEESPDAEPGSSGDFGYDEYQRRPTDDAILERLRADRDRPRTVQVTGPDGIRLARFEPLPRRDIPMTIIRDGHIEGAQVIKPADHWKVGQSLRR